MIGERIREIRKRKKMTQKELAEKCGGMADSAIRKYESGSVTPKFDTMARIASALDVPVTALMGYVFRGVGPDGKDIYTPPDDEVIQIIPYTSDAVDKKPKENPLRISLLESFDSLNAKGQRKAVERVDELAEIAKYQKHLQTKK